jgi:hypothetical protein
VIRRVPGRVFFFARGVPRAAFLAPRVDFLAVDTDFLVLLDAVFLRLDAVFFRPAGAALRERLPFAVFARAGRRLVFRPAALPPFRLEGVRVRLVFFAVFLAMLSTLQGV